MAMNVHLPIITKANINNEWILYFDEDLSPYFLENDSLKKTIVDQITPYLFEDETYKKQFLLEGANYLLNINGEKKEVRLGSVRLSNEIFLLDQLEKSSLISDLDVDYRLRYSEFKSHVTEILKTRNDLYPGLSNIITRKENLVDLKKFEDSDFVDSENQLSKKLVTYINDYSPSLFEKFSDFALTLTANYSLIRIHLLKFVAMLPSLDHDLEGSEVKRMLLESLRRLIADSKKARTLELKGEDKPLPTSMILACYFAFFVAKIIPSKLLSKIVRFKIRFIAKRFIAGESIELAETNFTSLFTTKRDVTLDQLGELVVSEKEADHYMSEVLNLVTGFSKYISPGAKNAAGIYRAHVSIKVSALCSDFKPEAFDYTYSLVAPRLKKILLKAKEDKVFINIDAEHYHYRDIVFDIYKKVLLETPELKDFGGTGIVLQAYLRDGINHLRDIIELGKLRGITMPIRIVKGAYWDAETIEADATATDAPEFLNKEETDINFRQLIYEIFNAYPHVQLAIASHNYSDHVFSEVLREKKFKDLPPIEHQCLHMTYEALSMAMAKMGWVTRNYVPIGSLIVGMAYLVRRIMENSSQVGVLTIMRSHKKKAMLLSPLEIFKDKKERGELVQDKSITNLDGSYQNIAQLRTYLDDELRNFDKTLRNYKLGLAPDFGHTSGELVSITSPSDLSVKVGEVKFATLEDTEKALKCIDEDFYAENSWSQFDPVVRESILLRAALIMHARRDELSALIMYESGKPFKEALADVDEAIDFINFYVRKNAEITKEGSYSRGPTGVIAPWNFPLAIPTGMTVSSLIAGNTVILKPAEPTPLITMVMTELLYEAGVPKTSLICLPGVGEIVGQKIIEDKRISTIIFTGSKPVGVHISKTALKRVYFNRRVNREYPVKVITEMGGKNALIVTNNAEMDETVDGILYSAFAHAGQKCSALSRVIVDNKIKERLIERLKEACADIKVGSSLEYSTYINPLITSDEKKRLLKQVKEAREEAIKYGGRVIIDRSGEDLPGNCVGPVLIDIPSERALNKDSYSQKELFAPVVHLIGFDTFKEGVRIFNSVNYGLTGGIFSQSEDDIEDFSSRFAVGNIYINRPITGARVGIEPFGGFKLSGTGPKAGGHDYMKSFYVKLNLEHENRSSIFEKGSSYTPKLSRPSGLALKNRLERVEKSFEEIINNFGPLFPGIFGNDKEKILNIKEWLNTDYQVLLNNGRDNHKIPGQISFSKFDFSKSRTLYFATTDRPNIDCFLYFLMALAVGSGVTILTTNQKSYVWWQYLIDIVIKCGISRANVDCFFSDDESIKKMRLDIVDMFIVDTDKQGLEKIVDKIEKSVGAKKMAKIITPFETAYEDDINELFFQFTNERSFAINTMRHGAPMELNQ